jgi:hypothetical protein
MASPSIMPTASNDRIHIGLGKLQRFDEHRCGLVRKCDELIVLI